MSNSAAWEFKVFRDGTEVMRQAEPDLGPWEVTGDFPPECRAESLARRFVRECEVAEGQK